MHVGIDSNLVPVYTDNAYSGFRLLCVDQLLVVPQNIHVTFLITSTDVLHS